MRFGLLASACVASVATLYACGLSSMGTGTDDSFILSDAGARSDHEALDAAGVVVIGSEAGSNDGGSHEGGDAGADASRCASGCSEKCPEACGGALACGATQAKQFCIVTGACVNGCDNNNCGGATDDCYVCDPGTGLPGDGGPGNPRRVCSTPTTGFCATGLYPHCRCATAADCHDKAEVCTPSGVCVPCGEPGATTNGLTCKCASTAKCDVVQQDCPCP